MKRMDNPYILELENISKSFGAIEVLHDINLKVKQGTVHALLGENGAGKSTLMKIINGTYMMDHGTTMLNGCKMTFKSIREASEQGVAMVHQELSYAPNMTVAENMFLGREPKNKLGFVNVRKQIRDTKELLEKEDIHINPNTRMGDLPVSSIQMIEIIKAISSDAKLVIMDEPTSALSDHEVEKLFEKIRELCTCGITVIYISHKLDEIKQIADYVTVLRDGSIIETGDVNSYDIDTIINMMVGRKMDEMFPENNAEIGEEVLRVNHLTSKGVFYDINLSVKRGEIVGLAGLMGAGRSEIVRTLFGLDSYDSGEIWLEGKQIKIRSVQDAISHGIMMVTEDRARFGIIPERSVRENASVSILEKLSGIKGINLFKEKQIVQDISKTMNVKTPSIEYPIKSLSGGNQQKVILSRWILANPKVLILDEPTRGIDVGAKYEIYNLVVQMAKNGISVILITSELPELVGMADHLYVIRKGKMIKEIKNKADITQETVLKVLSGGD